MAKSSETTFHYAVLNLPAFSRNYVHYDCHDFVVWWKYDLKIGACRWKF